MSMRGLWWKILTAVLLCYVFVAAFFIPLKPGISALSVSEQVDLVKISVRGYRTHFEDTSLCSWLAYKNVYICPKQTTVVSQDSLIVYFDISNQQSAHFDFLLNNHTDGTIFYPKVLFITDTAIFPHHSGVCDFFIDKNKHKNRQIHFPYREILRETIRNLFFHVPMWFGMTILLFIGFVYSIKYLSSGNINFDFIAKVYTQIAILYGIIGIFTGMLWAQFTWNYFWPNDPKLNGAAVGILIYLAYVVLRESVEDESKKARLASVYHVFAFPIFITFIFIIPRLTESMHPGNGGNPGFNQYDLDSTMRFVFYPAVVAWTLLGVWMASIWIRMHILKHRMHTLD